MDSYVTILNQSRFEYEDRRSVFIGQAMPVSTESDALAFIESVRRTYPDARHHVYAYVLRDNSIMRFTDDREPQGTAGMPVLDVIRKRGCTDTVIVVTRYFGGTLLGTGGLVRAYTAAAQGALESARIITYDVYSEYRIEVSYSDYQRLGSVFSEYAFRVEDTRFTDNVTVCGRLCKKQSEDFARKVTETSGGRAYIEFISERFDF